MSDGGRASPGPGGPAEADHPPVVAIVAAKDAAASVGETVRALAAVPGVDEVVVVDDGSGDDTTAAARRAGAWVLRLPENGGKGAAVAAGVRLADHAGTYLLVDADVGPTASAVSALLDPVLGGEADMAIGVLPGAGRKGGFGLVKRLARAGIRRATGLTVQAPLSGQRAVRGDLLRRLEPASRFGLETALTIDARRAGARVVEVPVTMDHRHTGRSLRGFAHRGRQGADIFRALWPRLTTPTLRVGLIAVALVTAIAASLWSGERWEAASVPPTAEASKVLIVGFSGLRWDEVGTGRLPNLDRLIAEGALAAMTVRTLSREPSAGEAYATLGAGARVQADAAAERAFGNGTGPVVVTDAARVRREAGPHLASKPGALGDALHAAGLRTAVVGNADTPGGLSGVPGLHPVHRPAAVALMDGTGRVDGGSVDPADLLVTDRSAAFEQRANPERMVTRTAEGLASADVVLVDPGDMDRVADLARIAPADYVAQFRDLALTWTDDLLGRLVDEAPPGTLVLVVSPRPPADDWRLMPVVAHGAGVVRGYLHSLSTRRLGLVTITDLAPTIIDALGAEEARPSGMVGHALRYHPGTPDPGRLGGFDRDIAHRERIYVGVTLSFIAFQAVAYGLMAWVLSRPQRPSWSWVLRDVALAIAAFPLGTLLFRLVTPFAPRLGTPGVLLLPLLIAGAVFMARRARRSPLAPLGWIFGSTAWLLLLDVVTGGRLQVGGILGYSPQSAGRFFGLGNTTFAVLAACSVLAAAIHLSWAPRRREALAAVAAFLVFVVVVDGAPSLGSDVGGVLTLVPVFGLTFVALAGRRLTGRTVAAAVGIAVVLLALAAIVDLLRPPDARTHLGRLVSDTWNDGPGELMTTMARKAEVNLRLLWQTPWAWAVPVIAGFVVYVLVVRRGADELLPPGSPVRIGVLGALAAGILGFLVNDSGVVVTALVLVEVGPVLAVLALGGGGGGGPPVLLEPATDAPTRSSLAARRR